MRALVRSGANAHPVRGDQMPSQISKPCEMWETNRGGTHGRGGGGVGRRGGVGGEATHESRRKVGWFVLVIEETHTVAR